MMRLWLRKVSFITFILGVSVTSAFSQTCPGDCSGDRTVSVDELVVCLAIGLKNAPRGECSACDTNSDGRVAIDELVAAVAAALRLLTTEANGMCVRPGPSGLVPCAEGTMVQVGRCDDRGACLRNANAVVSVAADPVGPGGRFSLVMDRCQISGATLVFEADVAPETTTMYRTMEFGSLFGGLALGLEGGVPFDDVFIGPSSEAAVRVLRENGLENFDDQGAAEIFAIAEVSNAETDFSGLDVESAADLAEQTAAADPIVQEAVDRNRTLCTNPEFTLQLDNGSPFQGIGVNDDELGAPFIWLNRHIVNRANLPIRISALSNIWPADFSLLVGGESAQMLIYVDADADGDPSNADLVASQPLRIPTPDNQVRQVHPFEEPVLIDRPGDVYVGFADLESGRDQTIRFMAFQDDSGGGARSFLIFSQVGTSIDLVQLGNNDVIQPLSEAGLPGAWVVRAHGTCN